MSELTLVPHPGIPAGWMHDRVWHRGRRVFRSIEHADLEELRSWRNAQQAVLRQQHPLTPEHQQKWFSDVVRPSYEATHPGALLVIMLADDQLVGYGGLTNIEWVSRRAELSFLAASAIAADPVAYGRELSEFLDWVWMLAFDELELNRVFAETWAFRTEHIEVLERAGMRPEGRMRQHVAKDGVVHDAVVHGVIRADRSGDS